MLIVVAATLSYNAVCTKSITQHTIHNPNDNKYSHEQLLPFSVFTLFLIYNDDQPRRNTIARKWDRGSPRPERSSKI